MMRCHPDNAACLIDTAFAWALVNPAWTALIAAVVATAIAWALADRA